jgi:periplasmic divalent cation tolerance protein
METIMSDYLEIRTTIDTQAGAQTIASTLLAQRLAACVQISGPIQSAYWWDGQIETAGEWLCTIKTRADHYTQVEATIKAIHPYEVPEILATTIVTGNPDYLAWIDRETVPNGTTG